MSVLVAKRRFLSITPQQGPEAINRLEKRLRPTRELITFDDDDFNEHPNHMIMPLLCRLVKRLLIDQSSVVEIMYPDLYKGLGLKSKDMTKYDTPLVGTMGKVMVPRRQIFLPIMTKGKEVMVNVIVVNAFSLYMTILGWPWIHVMGVVLFTLHIKVKFPIKDGISVVKGDQRVARQCLMAMINHKIKQKEQVELESL